MDLQNNIQMTPMHPDKEIVDFIAANLSKQIPIVIKTDRDYLPKLHQIFQTYCKEVDKVSFLENKRTLIHEVCNKLESAIEYYYNGLIAKAYHCIADLFKEDKLGDSPYVRLISEFSNGTEYKTLYKGRNAEEVYSLGEMFHRPFSQRQFMYTERYSIPGLPCLYMAGSVYTCWIEVGKPDFKDFYVSRFEADEEVAVLDLAISPSNVLSGEYKAEIACVLWPLVCAVSFHVREKNRIMKSEYIISQLLMQMVIESNRIHGVRYFSVHMPQNTQGYACPVYANYAFPAPYSKDVEYSQELINMFRLTSPICMNEIFVLSPAGRWTAEHDTDTKREDYKLEACYNNEKRRNTPIKVGLDRMTEYESTAFFEIEKLLYTFQSRRLDE